MQTEFVVQTKNLCKAFAGKEVIHDCIMSVERGTIYGFLGKNGAGKTTLLILDEPVNGLDPVGIKEMRELFCDLVKRQKITILLSSHILSEIDKTADRIGVIVNCNVVQEISPQERKEQYPNLPQSAFPAKQKNVRKSLLF